MSIDYSRLAYPKKTPKVVERKATLSARTAAAKKMRDAVWKRAGGKCERCGKRVTRGGDSVTAGHVHHRVFRSRGGKDTAANGELVCGICHTGVHERRTR